MSVFGNGMASRRGALRMFCTMYPEPNPIRKAEYIECITRNLALTQIDELCVLQESGGVALPQSSKLRVRSCEARPDYAEFFAWINDVAAADDISIIANTDIWFDSGVGAAAWFLKPQQCYALARWEETGIINRNDSQDAWVFRGRVCGVEGDFPLGVPRCDNRLMYELVTAGYEVLNPAFSIRAWHRHAGDRAEYGADLPHFVKPPFRYLWPHNLLGPARTIVYNVRHNDAKIGWRFDRRRFWGSFPMRVATRVFARPHVTVMSQATRTKL